MQHAIHYRELSEMYYLGGLIVPATARLIETTWMHDQIWSVALGKWNKH